MSFADFKKRSQSSINELTKKIEETNKKESYTDDRFWRPELDKSSNGYAVIRFLPAVDGEDLPWAKYYSHGFQGKGGWFIENCPTTLGQKCPVCESNSELWNSVLKRIRTLHETANGVCIMCQTLWLLVILRILKMKVKCFFTNLVRRFLIKSTKQ